MPTTTENQVSSEKRIESLFEAVTIANPESMPIEPEEVSAFFAWQKSEDFYRMDAGPRRQKINEFWDQEFVKDYFQKKWAAQLHNRDAILWLVDFRNNYMDKSNAAQAKAVEIKLRQFLTAIKDQKAIYPALKIDREELGIANIKTTFDAVAWDD